jgi:hypothetical protein
METRREFLACIAPLYLGVLGRGTLPEQERPRRPMPDPPQPAGPSETIQETVQHNRTSEPAKAQRERFFRVHVKELYEKVRELKQEVDETPTMQVFSVKIYKQSAEIAKLAKQVKSLSRS